MGGAQTHRKYLRTHGGSTSEATLMDGERTQAAKGDRQSQEVQAWSVNYTTDHVCKPR